MARERRPSKFITLFWRLFSFAILGCLAPAFGIDQADWARLLHFEYSLIRQDYVPAVFNSEFYLSPQALSLERELELSRQEFARAQEVDRDSHPLCRFPARGLFLQKYYGLQLPFQLNQCPKFWQFKSKIEVESVALVFSSYYMANASSAFGHTLLRLKRQGGAGQELLDYGVNYAALMTTHNPILYGLYGIFGGFQGNFSMTPYFFKIREYNDMESRDLWEYEINLTPQELAFLVAHLWELDRARFTYYYLRKNCAYKILQLLDIVRPELNLIDKLGYFVIPVDTIHALFKVPGLISKVSLRPSQQRKLKARLKALSSAQRKTVLGLIPAVRQKKLGPQDLHNSQAAVLDALIESTDYLFAQQLLLGKGEDVRGAEAMKMLLLTQRSQLSAEEFEGPKLSQVVSPHLGLPSRRFELGMSDSNFHGPAVNLAYRFSLQDALELGDGHSPNTELEMGHFFFRYLSESRRFYVHDARIVSVIERNPWSEMERPWSWQLRFGAKDLIDTDSLELAPYATLGAGPTWGLNDDQVILSAFIYTEDSYSSKDERHGGRVDLGLRPSILFRLTPQLTFQQEWSRARVLTAQKKWFKDANLSLQWTVNSRFSLQGIYHYQGTNQAQLNLLGYF